jgi:hypothetical protein
VLRRGARVAAGLALAGQAIAADPPERLSARLTLPVGCPDRTFPRLVGDVIVACGPDGVADRVVDLSTAARSDLGLATSPFVGDGWLWDRGSGRLSLPDGEPGGGRLPDDAFGVAVDGDRVFAVLADRVVLARVGSPTAYEWPSRPLPWYPPAAGAGRFAWVVDDGAGSSDLAALRPEAGAWAVEPLAAGPGRQHHVVGHDGYLAWVDDGDVVVLERDGATRHTWPADAGFEGAPALFGPEVCWEDRSGGGQRVRCSDGWSTEGRLVSGAGPLLLVDTARGPTLFAATWWPVDGGRRDADGAVWIGPWWGEGEVTVEVADMAGWSPVSRVRVGRTPVRVEVPPGPLRAVPTRALPAGVP